MHLTTIFICFVSILLSSFADNRGCPHPAEAKHLIQHYNITAPPDNDQRKICRVEIPSEYVKRNDLTCISVVANQKGATPDFISFGRDNGSYTVILHSRLRTPVNVSLYVYTS